MQNVRVTRGDLVPVGGVTLPAELVDEGGKVAECLTRAAAPGSAGTEYYKRKWGSDTTCLDVTAPCSLPYSRPFGRAESKLREWTLELNRRAWIISGKGGSLEAALAADKDKDNAFEQLGIDAQNRKARK